MLKINRFMAVLLFVIGAGILALSAVRAESYLQDVDRYIEVCASGTVYVPANVRYVKCYGVIKKVAFITENLSREEDECQCPKCCDGLCYVIIFADPDPGPERPDAAPGPHKSKDIRYLWLIC